MITIATVLGFSLTYGLGRWQLDRAFYKESLAKSWEYQSTLPTLEVDSLISGRELEKYVHRRVKLTGIWLPKRTFFLENRQMNGKEGLYVYTPFAMEHTKKLILVQRGWVARNFLDREQLPDIATPSGLVTMNGKIALGPGKLFQIGKSPLGKLRQNIELSDYIKETGLDLLPVCVLQTDPDGEGMSRNWPVLNAGVQTHYGYAFQWFALSALISILYIWFQIFKRFIPAK